MKQLVTSKAVVTIGIALAVLVLILGSFVAGINVGFRKARFSYQWGENYERNFVGSRRGMMGGRGSGGGMMRGFGPDIRGLEGREFRNAHGVTGMIISISDNSLVIKDRDDKENTVTITDQTLIRRMREELKMGDLKVDDQVVIVGKPDDSGVIQATLVRVFPKVGN